MSVWKQPDYSQLNAPPEIKDTIYKSIYWNSEGRLKGASISSISQYIVIIFMLWIISASIILVVFQSLFVSLQNNIFVSSLIVILVLIGLLYLFYTWGWNTYDEAWYYFDEKNEMLSVIKQKNGTWEITDIPYEEVENIKWNDGSNGFASINAAGFIIPTARAKEKRAASVTELWPKLARIDAEMKNWPIQLECKKCNREFGHHIGTARCPWCEIILIEPDVKGRIDRQEQHPDDLDRI